MKKNFLIYLLMITVTVFLIQACNNKHVSDQTAETNNTEISSASKDLYTCSMHPQVLQDHPGNCPICGMKLIKKNEKPVAISNIKLETLLRPTNEFVVASLPVITPQESEINIPVNAYGTIEADTRAAGTVSARVSGRIEKLYVRYRFQNVKEGQKVLEIYSPELLTAQQNLLFLIKNDAQNTSFINAAKQKLLLLGMSTAELNKVIEEGKPLYSMSVYSNYSGYVTGNGNQNEMNNAATITQELPMKEGMYINKGQPLFNIINRNKSWIAIQIFPDDQPLIKKGDAVQIIPETDAVAVIKGKIDFIEPFFRGNSKTLTARVYFDNINRLTLGSQVTAKILTGTKRGLWLPQKAVLTIGMGDVAFLKSNGGFLAHKITTGIRVDNKVQILSGLNPTDTVAANAQFLMDSESYIKTSSN
jgi:Cu(I)/Ag(I) efflux system membrane fusion protein